MKQTIVTYGPGGFDPKLPNDNVVNSYEIDVPDPIPTAEERLDALVAALETATTIAQVREAAGAAKRRETPTTTRPVRVP